MKIKNESAKIIAFEGCGLIVLFSFRSIAETILLKTFFNFCLIFIARSSVDQFLSERLLMPKK